MVNPRYIAGNADSLLGLTPRCVQKNLTCAMIPRGLAGERRRRRRRLNCKTVHSRYNGRQSHHPQRRVVRTAVSCGEEQELLPGQIIPVRILGCLHLPATSNSVADVSAEVFKTPVSCAVGRGFTAWLNHIDNLKY